MLKGSLPEVFPDIDVAIDILLKRKPYYENSIQLLKLAADDRVALLLAESSLANLIYLSIDIYKLPDAESRLLDFISACEIISGGKPAMIKAISSPFADKKDALQYSTALDYGADYFVTRNIKNYKSQSKMLLVFTPLQFVHSLK